jgi:transposase
MSAVEACTGWLFVCRGLERAGAVAHLAEPVETRALRGRKRHAKTDRADAKWLRQRLCEGRPPEAWCPPEHVCQWRSHAQLRNTLLAERTSWIQRIRATRYHHGVAGAPDDLRTLAGRQFLAGLDCRSTRQSGSGSRWRSSTCSRSSSRGSNGSCAGSPATRLDVRR